MPSQVVKIKLYRNEILFDVQNNTDKIHRSTPSDVPVPVGSQVRYEDTEQNVGIISRAITKYVSKLQSRLAAYIITKEIADIRSGDRTIEDAIEKDNASVTSGDIDFYLEFPETWRPEVADELKDAMSNYVINSSCFEFLKFSNPGQAKNFLDLAEENNSRIKICINSRYAGEVLRPLQPFREIP